MPFTDAEIAYLAEQRLGRIATADADGEPDVAPVGFSIDGVTVRIGGMAMRKTRKLHNVRANGQASFVVDDLASIEPWRPRGIKVTGGATVEGEAGHEVIVITPHTIWSWGVNRGRDTVFGPIEKRPADQPVDE